MQASQKPNSGSPLIGFSTDPCQHVNRLQADHRVSSLRLGETLWVGGVNVTLPDSAVLQRRQPGQTPRVPGHVPGLLVMMTVMREELDSPGPSADPPVYCSDRLLLIMFLICSTFLPSISDPHCQRCPTVPTQSESSKLTVTSHEKNWPCCNCCETQIIPVSKKKSLFTGRMFVWIVRQQNHSLCYTRLEWLYTELQSD